MHVSDVTWIVTLVILIAVLLFDVLIIGRRPHEPSTKECSIAIGIYVVGALLFACFVWWKWGHIHAGEFIAGWLTEYSLSIDNLFIFLLIMASMKVPRHLQQYALMVGIVLALILRGIFIALGAAVIARFAWVFFLFGAFLVYTAYGLVRDYIKGEEEEAKENAAIRWVKKTFKFSDDFDGTKLGTKQPAPVGTTVAETRQRLPFWGRWSLGWTLFIGVGAVVGAVTMWVAPDLMGIPALLADMQVLPFAGVFFTSSFWPGLFLFVINGVTQIVTAVLILRRNKYAPVATIVCGAILVGWIILQFVIFPTNPYSICYFFFGLAEVAMAVLWMVRPSRAPVKPNTVTLMTPMFLVIVALGSTDLLFALDSIPAIYGLTQQAYLVFAANVFALMGLRQLYFLIGGMLKKLVYLSIGLSVILAFIGVKLVLHALHHYNVITFEVPLLMSLGVIIGTLVVTTVASLIKSAHMRNGEPSTADN